MQWARMFMLCLVITTVGAQQKDEESSEVVLGSGSLWDRFLRAPSLNFYVGVGRFGREGLQQETSPPTVLSLHLGSASLHPFPQGTSVVEYERAYLFLSSVNLGLRVGPGDGGSYLRGWYFGFGNEGGYGYRLGEKGHLVLTHGAGLQWMVAQLQDTVPEALAAFHRRLRFGVWRDGAVIVQFSPLMGAGVSFGRSVVFPAHTVWKHLGSMLIEASGHWLVERFVQRVLQAHTPAAAPVVGFVLHNGLAIGWYELLRTRMNWPFQSAAPLWLDGLRFHLQWLF